MIRKLLGALATLALAIIGIVVPMMWDSLPRGAGAATLVICGSVLLLTSAYEVARWRTRSNQSASHTVPLNASGDADYKDPPRRWNFGFGQGHQQGLIRNNRGASFAVSYGAGTENPITSVWLSSRDLKSGPKANQLDAVIDVDGEPWDWFFDDDGNGSFHSVAAGWRNEAHILELVEKMKLGKSVSVTIPSRRIRESFSLAGAREALESVYGNLEDPPGST